MASALRSTSFRQTGCSRFRRAGSWVFYEQFDMGDCHVEYPTLVHAGDDWCGHLRGSHRPDHASSFRRGHFKFAHEPGGISFSAAILLHVLSHRQSFTNYFRQRGALGIVVTAWAIGVGLVAGSSVLNMGEAEALIVDRIDSAPLAMLAPVVDMDVRQVVDRLGDEGFVVNDPEMSIRQLAQ